MMKRAGQGEKNDELRVEVEPLKVGNLTGNDVGIPEFEESTATSWKHLHHCLWLNIAEKSK